MSERHTATHETTCGYAAEIQCDIPLSLVGNMSMISSARYVDSMV
jgi:hypothetical protein